MRISDLEVARDIDRVGAQFKCIKDKRPDRFESKHRRKNGTIFDVEVSIQFLPEERVRNLNPFREQEKHLQNWETGY